MHRRFADRMLSMLSPVRRYGCMNHLCGHEAILWENSALTQRPIVAIAGLVGAAFAGALVTGFGLYAASDESTRAEVRDAYSNVMQTDTETHPDPTLALPVSRALLEPKFEAASKVRDAYSSVMQTDTETHPDPTLALPVSRALPEPRYETASILEINSNPDNADGKTSFMPPVPTLVPAAQPAEQPIPGR